MRPPAWRTEGRGDDPLGVRKQGELPLSVRRWSCSICGVEHDRDLNAAINLKNYTASSTVSACGGEGAGLGGDAKAKPAPMKQEVSFVPV